MRSCHATPVTLAIRFHVLAPSFVCHISPPVVAKLHFCELMKEKPLIEARGGLRLGSCASVIDCHSFLDESRKVVPVNEYEPEPTLRL